MAACFYKASGDKGEFNKGFEISGVILKEEISA
jgi:hypothetical protein